MKWILGLVFSVALMGQSNPPIYQPMFNYLGTQLPTKCNNGDLFYNVSTYLTYRCGPNNSWVIFNQYNTGIFMPQSFGAKADGINDDSNPITLCVNAAWEVGGICQLPYGAYKLQSGINLPVASSGSGFVTINGSGSFGAQQGNGVRLGTYFICPNSVKCMSANFTNSSSNTYNINNIQLIGSGNTSGDGISICCKAQADSAVNLNNVSVSGFTGIGKWGITLDGAENSNLLNISVNLASNGLKLSTAANANVVSNLTCQQVTASGDCLFITNSSGVEIFGGNIQNTDSNGVRFKGVTNSSIYGMWFENTNQVATLGRGAIILDSSNSSPNQAIVISAIRLGTANDHIIATGDGSSVSVGVTVDTVLGNNVAVPLATLDASATGWKLRNWTNLDGCSKLVDLGINNVVDSYGTVFGCGAQKFAGNIFGKIGINMTNPSATLQMLTDSGVDGLQLNAGFPSGINSTSYSYFRPFYNGGQGGPRIGGSYFNGSPEVDVLQSDVRFPWLGLGGVLQLKTYQFSDFASFNGNQTNPGTLFLCSNCVVGSPCTAGGTAITLVFQKSTGVFNCLF